MCYDIAHGKLHTFSLRSIRIYYQEPLDRLRVPSQMAFHNVLINSKQSYIVLFLNLVLGSIAKSLVPLFAIPCICSAGPDCLSKFLCLMCLRKEQRKDCGIDKLMKLDLFRDKGTRTRLYRVRIYPMNKTTFPTNISTI